MDNILEEKELNEILSWHFEPEITLKIISKYMSGDFTLGHCRYVISLFNDWYYDVNQALVIKLGMKKQHSLINDLYLQRSKFTINGLGTQFLHCLEALK